MYCPDVPQLLAVYGPKILNPDGTINWAAKRLMDEQANSVWKLQHPRDKSSRPALDRDLARSIDQWT